MHRAFVGFGELGIQIASMVDQTIQPAHTIVFDDLALQKGMPDAYPFNDYADDAYADYDFYVCLGYKHLQRKYTICDHLEALGRALPSYQAPSAFVNRSAILGPGAIVYPLSNIDKDVHIGRGSLINNSAVVSHNCHIGNCCYLSPGVILSGYVSVGDCTFIGAGATVTNNISIGRNVTVGIGTVVTADIPDSMSVIGNPMRILEHRLRIA